MSKLQKTWIIFILMIPPGIPITLHAYLGSFTRLIADDYCTFYNTQTLGVLGTAWYWYRTWTGVYARSLINEILIWIGPYNMQMIVPGVLMIWWLATGWVFYLLLERKNPSKYRLWISLSASIAFISTVLLISPQLTQSLYWWGGLSAYTIPLVLATFYVAIFLMFAGKERGRKAAIAMSVLSFFMAFGLGGISESFTPIPLVFIAFVAGWGLMTKQLNLHHPALWFLSAGLFGTTLALLIIVAAPGNAIRQSYFPPHPGILDIVRIASAGYLDFLATTFVEPTKFTGILGVFLGSAILGVHATTSKTPRPWAAPAILALGIFFAFLCFPPTAYGMSNVPPRRVLIISAFMLVAGLMGSGYAAGIWLSSRTAEPFIHVLTRVFLLATTLLIGFSTWITSQNLYDSRSIYIEYADLWDQVDAQIHQAKANGEESVTIPALGSWTGLDRPNPNPKFWATACYTEYYGIQVYGPPYGK